MPLQQPIRAKRIDVRPDEYFSGIPNRDITEDQYEALTNDQRALVRTSGLWDVKTDAQMEPAIRRVERQAEKATIEAEKQLAAAEGEEVTGAR